MTFEEQFPSLNKDSRYCPYPLENVSAFHVEAIKEHCLDKQRTYFMTTEQLLELFAKGQTITNDSLKLDCMQEPEKYGTIVKKILNLEEYKQRVKEAIEKVSEELCEEGTGRADCPISEDFAEALTKELGL